MAQAKVELLAACGLDCGPCPIRRIPFDREQAAYLICVSLERLGVLALMRPLDA